ncbi:Rod binding domain-containing protein [Azospirillum agricola]|uniref:rod-binding protein n=1 Tax=Azospirillum agricola TaxID=1720247 RepID=UPI001AE670C2|nr:rod-binding protein [Azospirillum agricola]MBP2231151.1 Rod binding domain-containing protein [Azospirillum agricola]
MDVSAANHHRPTAAAPATVPAAADKVAQEFEAMIVGQMMESMFAGLESSATFGGGGPSEKPWRSFMLQEYGKAIAEAGTLGIGAMVREEVARLYAAQQAPQSAQQPAETAS